VFCRAKDFDGDEFECKVMRLDDFLRQVKKDKDHTKGYRVLLDALRMEYPKEVEKYMVLEQRLHGSSEGPARIKHKKKHPHRQPAPYSIVMAPQLPQMEESSDDEEEEEKGKDTITDLNTLDKRIGFGLGVDNQIALEEAAAAGSSVNGEEMNFIMRYKMARFIDRNSTACKIEGITQCGVHLPEVSHTLEARMTALAIEQSRTAKLLADGGDPTTGRTWHFSLFDI